MQQIGFGASIRILALFLVAGLLPAVAAAASQYKVLHAFKGTPDGAIPLNGLIFDPAGNLYGTTQLGGSGFGTVFKLAPNSDGTWTESVLHKFTYFDGEGPEGALILDAAGNLYGTTPVGGTSDGFCNFTGGACGTVFRLTPTSDGTWTYTILHTFNWADGFAPSGLVIDAAGTIYGTTGGGGDTGYGVVFKLVPNSDGSWTESVLHSFTLGSDGGAPFGAMIFDADGNLYGTTTDNVDPKCSGSCGKAFKLSPNSDGTWTLNVLYGFTGGADGGSPVAGLTFNTAGNLYGTTAYGGAYKFGGVFELQPNPNGTWTEQVLHSFANNPAAIPLGGVILDAAGTLYGDTQNGGPEDGGTVFKLGTHSGASRVLHVFQGNPAISPQGNLVFDKAGNLYGTTAGCRTGVACQGVVYEITP